MTSFGLVGRKRYENHRKNKIRKKEWILAMKHGEKRKKWMLYDDEIYYMGPGRNAAITIFLEDAEIILDEDGEVYEIIVRNINRHMDKEDLEKIAYEQLLEPARKHEEIERPIP